MLYLIGIGLNEGGISLEGKEALAKCRKVYLEGYTVDFPYPAKALEAVLKKEIEILGRSEVETDRLVKESRKFDVALLVYGSPLFATTHSTLIIECKKEKIPVRIIHSASVFDAISECGLQLYKFGKVTSMPKWQKNFEPDSFMESIKDNTLIKAHSLVLCDIGLDIIDALYELKTAARKKKIKLDKIILCSRLGTKDSKIYYDTLNNLKTKAENEKIELPFCIIIPNELHFMEKEFLESL